jgi:hypothetical protein
MLAADEPRLTITLAELLARRPLTLRDVADRWERRLDAFLGR